MQLFPASPRPIKQIEKPGAGRVFDLLMFDGQWIRPAGVGGGRGITSRWQRPTKTSKQAGDTLEPMEPQSSAARFQAFRPQGQQIRGVCVFGTHRTNGTKQFPKLGEIHPPRVINLGGTRSNILCPPPFACGLYPAGRHHRAGRLLHRLAHGVHIQARINLS